MDDNYEGDVSVGECWSALQSDPDAFLIDVRTSVEWAYVGVPHGPDDAHAVLFAEWQQFPAMRVDPAFADRVSGQIAAHGGSKDSRLYFICRSGARSAAGAATMTAAGFLHCRNVADGFEGPVDGEGHRGGLAGWKAEGLPWSQR